VNGKIARRHRVRAEIARRHACISWVLSTCDTRSELSFRSLRRRMPLRKIAESQ
jgi:hypothetical protein